MFTGVDRPFFEGYNNTTFGIQCNWRVPVANEVGKRYVCAKCGSEFMVTKAGQGAITCCGEQMKKK
jgi:DNA-directed RNA polymerase subunit RPC12/RpoP